MRETVYKQDKEETKKKRRIVAFVNWKMAKVAQILTFVVIFFLFMHKTNMPSQNVERTSVKHSLKVPVPLFFLNFDVICDVVLMIMMKMMMMTMMMMMRETVYKHDEEETRKKKRIVAFLTWKIPKLAQILQSSGLCLLQHFAHDEG